MPRDARNGSARDRATTGTGRRAGRTATGRRDADRHRQGRPRSGSGTGNPSRRGSTPAPAPLPETLVVGAVPPTARLTGALLVLAGLVGIAGAFPTYLVLGGERISLVGGAGTALVAVFPGAVSVAVGGTLLRRAVPKLGLAYAGVSGALAVGELFIELYRGSSSTARPGVEFVAGQRVLTSSVEVGAGWVLGVVALALTVLAGVCALVAWGRTVMEDSGSLDPARGGLAGGAVLLGVATVLCLNLPAADVSDQIVTDPTTGLQTVVPREGPQALLERPGLALLGGLLLAGALLLCSVVAPSLRPRLAAVGGLLAIAVAVLTAGLGGLRDAVVGADLTWTLPGAGLLLAGIGYAVLTVLAWRVRRAGR